jgi:sugar phosphate isomerase/epimerase
MTRRDVLKASAAGAIAAGLTGQAATPESAPAQPKKPSWQIGCYTRPWDASELGAALDAIAEAGYKYAGLMTVKSTTRLVISVATAPEEAERIGQEVRKRGLEVSSVYGGDIPVAKSLQDGVAGLRRLIDNCAAAKATSLLMGGVSDPKLYDAYYKAVAECCDYAASKKLPITIKPHGGLNADGPQCRKAVKTVNHENFRIWYDPGNILFYSKGELDPVKDAATVDGLVVGMSVKDYKHPQNVAVTPGAGQVDFKAVLGRLKQGGFTSGPLIVETLAPGDVKAVTAEAGKARRFLLDLTGQKDG